MLIDQNRIPARVGDHETRRAGGVEHFCLYLQIPVEKPLRTGSRH